MIQVTVFELADVAKILDMPKSKVTNWTIGRPFKFPASFQSGEGKGTRNLYSTNDIITMALANELRNAGLSTRDIGTILKLFRKERSKILPIRYKVLGASYLQPDATNWLIIELKANEMSVKYLIQDTLPIVSMPDEKDVVVGNYIMNLTALVDRIQRRINKIGKGISLTPSYEKDASGELNE